METTPGTAMRIENIVGDSWYSTSDPTNTNKEQFKISQEEYSWIRTKLDNIKAEIENLESKMDIKSIPYTPGRKNWKEE